MRATSFVVADDDGDATQACCSDWLAGSMLVRKISAVRSSVRFALGSLW
jgi:hypothetical protein